MSERVLEEEPDEVLRFGREPRQEKKRRNLERAGGDVAWQSYRGENLLVGQTFSGSSNHQFE